MGTYVMSNLPPGFVLEEAPAPSADVGLPPGFVLDEPVKGPQSSYLDAALRGVTQSATFNLGDEISAVGAAGGGVGPFGAVRLAAEAIAPSVFGDGGSKAYNQRLAELRARNKAAADQYPVTTFAGNLVGAVAMPVGAGVTGAANLAKLGAGTGALSGFGSGEGTEDRFKQAAFGGAAGAVLGYGVGRAIEKFIPSQSTAALPSPASIIGRDLDVPLSAGQRTGDVATRAREDAMLGGAYGEQAQRIASEFRTTQQNAMMAARDRIGQRAGDGILIDRPADAGALVSARISSVADDAASRIQAADAAEAARIAANEQAASGIVQRASGMAADNLNPTGATPISAASDAIDGVRSRAAAAKTGYQDAYREAFDRDGVIRPEFFTGLSRGNDLAVPGSPLNDFAEPLSKRIARALVNQQEPIIPDPAITPIASRALDQLDRVTNLNLGRIGQPVDGQDLAGVNLRGLEQARRIVSAGMKNTERGTPDHRALGGILTEFDNQIENVMQSALFAGDNTALDAIRNARSAFSTYQRTFKAGGAGDDAGRAIQKIVERDATPEEVSNFLFGASRLGDTGLSVRLFDRVKSLFGEGSDELQSIKGAAFNRLVGGDTPADPKTARTVAERIAESIDGRGSTLMNKMFSADERRGLMSYANILRSFASRQPETPGKLTVPPPVQTIMDVAAKRLSPEDTAGALLGYGNRITTNNIKLVDAVGDIVGRDTPEWNAIRQAAWMRLTGVADGKTEMGAQKVSERIFEFTNGSGATMAKKLFSGDEIAEMNKLGDLMKMTITPREAANYSQSGNRIAAMARQMSAMLGAGAGAAGGGPVGAMAGYAFGNALSRFSGMRAAKDARLLFSGVEPGAKLGARIAERIGSNVALSPAILRGSAPMAAPIGEQTIGRAITPLLTGPRVPVADGSGGQLNQEEQRGR
jgi:hypothetical protein